jgi:hypothetical protein
LVSLSNHTKLFNLVLDLIRSESENYCLKDYEVVWFEYDLSSGERSNRSTWPVDIILYNKEKKHAIVIECKGKAGLDDRDLEQLRRYKNLVPNDLIPTISPINSLDYLYFIVKEDNAPLDENFYNENVPTIIYTPEYVSIEGINLTSTLDDLKGKKEIKKFSIMEYPFSSEDNSKYIYNYLISSLVSLIKKSNDFNLSYNKIIDNSHRYLDHVSGSEVNKIVKKCSKLLNTIMGHKSVKKLIKKYSNKKIDRTRIGLNADINDVIKSLEEIQEEIEEPQVFEYFDGDST